MQNTDEPNEPNSNPVHFPPSTTTSSTSISIDTAPIGNGHPRTNTGTSTLATISERTQNFSFATNYRPAGRISNHNNISRFTHSSPLSIFQYKPLSSFTVLNNDELRTPFTTLDVGKPNAIVRPIRRPEQPGLQPEHSQQQPPQQCQYDSDTSAQQEQRQRQRQLMTQSGCYSLQDVDFTDELNRKLSTLHYSTSHGAWSKSGNSSRNGSNQDSLHNRPLFITTVPTGVFLPPPKEPPMPWFLRPHVQVYAYATQPKVLCTSTSGDSSSSPQQHHYHHPKSFSTFAKDKLRNSTAPIAASDKEFMTNTTRTSGDEAGDDTQRISAARYSLAGSVHLTKEQFQQQIQQRRAKRETPPVEPYKNVMHDRRVIRGSNFGNAALLADYDPFDRAAELRRRNALRQKKPSMRNQRNVLGTPPPVKGRCHEVMQTDKYLEELVQRPPEFSVDTQTDLFLERPPQPPYIPAKVGVDVGTEIADGELFHFDAEAQPIIDILVDACIEQSMLEVAHEQEIEALRRKQEEYLAKREAELAELRRLEAEELRIQAEKERRLRQELIAKELDEEMQKGVTAAKLLQGHIASLIPEVLDNLEPASDAVKKEHLVNTICPWLTVEVAEEVGHIVDSREILTVIIKEIIKQRATAYAGYSEEGPELPKEGPLGEEEGLEAECNDLCNCETEDTTDPDCPKND